ncbi:hypothetical protein [Couchioplanes azureus]|uniref:hypothetical protein n=1 Tax=Couchioplanes caeruleus TaxID=56438 RepID=UPI00166FC09D|nr:hypothetical protein [Couchioplanes caeruleus]GGQ77461.1 hypothetical protein GCM10010166_54260 [Couchioplanes caeruleus subsp. azureus]
MINTGGVINPGTTPAENASEALAVAALDVFLAEVRRRAAEMEAEPFKRRVAGLVGDPVRDPGPDRDGRFGWDLPFTDGRVVRLLMPGVRVEVLRDDITASAPCLYVNGTAWWWTSAVGMVAAEGLVLGLG